MGEYKKVIYTTFPTSRQLGKPQNSKTKFIFQIGTLNPYGINERFSFTNLFLFSRHNSVAPLSACKPTHNPQFFQSFSRRANARNVSLKTLYGSQFTLSSQLIILNHPVKLSCTDATPYVYICIYIYIYIYMYVCMYFRNCH